MIEPPSLSNQMQSFITLNDPMGRAFAHSGLGGLSIIEVNRYARGLAVPASPVRIEWGSGKRKPADIIWLGVAELAVSPMFLDTVKQFTGWSTYPVEVYDGWGSLEPGYAGLAITGRCGRMLHNLSRVEGEGKWAEYVGLEFAPETWDGSDMFYPSIGAGAIISKPLHDALRKAKITNYLATPLPEIRRSKEMVDRMRETRQGPYADEHTQHLP